jgi:hypothetical protein
MGWAAKENGELLRLAESHLMFSLLSIESLVPAVGLGSEHCRGGVSGPRNKLEFLQPLCRS